MAKAYGFGSPVDYNIGAEVITDTAAHTGRFKRIDFYENTHITTLVTENYTGNSLDGETIQQVFILRVFLPVLRSKNGACIAYKI